MAFVLSQSWDAGAIAPGVARAPLLPHRIAERSWRAGAVLLSTLVHLVLIVFLLNRIAGPDMDPAAERRNEGSVTMLDLSDPGSPAPAHRLAEVRPAATAAAQSPVDASAADPQIAAEWSVSRLPPAAVPRPASPAGSQAAGVGQGGGGVYDPYAGAAPLRGGPEANDPRALAGRVLGAFGLEQDGFALDETALEAVRTAVARSLPGQAGTAEMVVRVSPTGMVLEADAKGGSAPPPLRDALARALRGKRLFRGSADNAKIVALPVLRFG